MQYTVDKSLRQKQMISKVGSFPFLLAFKLVFCQIFLPAGKFAAFPAHANSPMIAERDAIDPKRAEEVLLDANEEARKYSFYMLGSFDISPDHNRLAYAEDTTGEFLSPRKVCPFKYMPLLLCQCKLHSAHVVLRRHSRNCVFNEAVRCTPSLNLLDYSFIRLVKFLLG